MLQCVYTWLILQRCGRSGPTGYPRKLRWYSPQNLERRFLRELVSEGEHGFVALTDIMRFKRMQLRVPGHRHANITGYRNTTLPLFSLKYLILVVAGESGRYGMVPAHNMAFLSHKSSSENGQCCLTASGGGGCAPLSLTSRRPASVLA